MVLRALRLIAYVLLLAGVAFITSLTFLVRNQDKIVAIALGRIQDRTGLVILVAGTRIGFGTHLVVVLEHPRVERNGAEVATLDDIRAVLSYSAIFHNSGLPLARLVLDRPQVRLPVLASGVTVVGVPPFAVHDVANLQWALDALSDISSEVDANAGVLSDRDGARLIDRLDLRARRSHRRKLGNWPWLVDFEVEPGHAIAPELRLTGRFSLGPQANRPNLAATGQFWFGGLDVRDFDLGVTRASASLTGETQLVLDHAGIVAGKTELSVSKLLLRPSASTQHLELGDYAASFGFRAAPDLVELSKLSVRQGFATILEGSAAIGNPFSDNRTLSFNLAGGPIALAREGAWTHAINRVNQDIATLAERFAAGELVFTRVILDTAEPLNRWNLATLRDHLTFDGTIRGASFQLPTEWGLPSLSRVAAHLNYSSRTLKITQGTVEIGGSQVEDLNAEAHLQSAPATIPYKLRLRAALDLAQLYPGARSAMRAVSPLLADRLTKLEGLAPLSFEASGDLNNSSWQVPRSYHASVTLGEVIATIQNASNPIALRDGKISLSNDRITFDKVQLVPVATDGGYATVDGTVEPLPAGVLVRNLTAEVHRVPVEDWLPLVVSPDTLAADGPVSGVIRAKSDSGASTFPVVTATLTQGTGHLNLGFLRSPVAVRSATLTLDGKGLALDAPGGQLEGAPLDLRIVVQDLTHPVMRIDANAGQLDAEVMKAIRLPWSPHRPPHFFAIPAYGHIVAAAGHFGKLPLSQVATDFSRNETDWQIDNFTAQVFNGLLKLQISGKSGPNNWIHMVGTIADMDAAPAFLLAGQTNQAPIKGKLSATADLWADTDVDFFDTLGGTVALEIHDGMLNRFRLLTRVISLLDLKNWLTAHFPDPRIAGLPFKKLSGDLAGTKGNFYTNNLRLEGPVMNISAQGEIDLGDGQIDLNLGLFPFDTVNWIVHQIPIVGTNLAQGSKGLVAAYFRVHGPFRDPAITPKPITSVTEFVKKMLGLPINIIAPDTIK
jgi:hypothetical protein